MNRAQLEHVIRAAAAIADSNDIVVTGSQAILGQFPNAPEAMRISAKADVYPLQHPERADLIGGSIGELSPFHSTYGYYAQGVSENTACLPRGWKNRLIVIQNQNTRGARGLCLEVHDLLAAKSIAGREKDIDFLSEAAAHGLADEQELLARLDLTDTSPDKIEPAKALVRRVFMQVRSPS